MPYEICVKNQQQSILLLTVEADVVSTPHVDILDRPSLRDLEGNGYYPRCEARCESAQSAGIVHRCEACFCCFQSSYDMPQYYIEARVEAAFRHLDFCWCTVVDM